MRTIVVNHQDLDSAKEVKIEISKQIQSLEEDSSSLENPISPSNRGRSDLLMRSRSRDSRLHLKRSSKIREQNDDDSPTHER